MDASRPPSRTQPVEIVEPPRRWPAATTAPSASAVMSPTLAEVHRLSSHKRAAFGIPGYSSSSNGVGAPTRNSHQHGSLADSPPSLIKRPSFAPPSVTDGAAFRFSSTASGADSMNAVVAAHGGSRYFAEEARSAIDAATLNRSLDDGVTSRRSSLFSSTAGGSSTSGVAASDRLRVEVTRTYPLMAPMLRGDFRDNHHY